ncbi:MULTISPECIES: hypothetical protein [Paenibacillus]|uniref:hypothetical protein n=1 Tax=Paenibacillus TaxID=44249 RepID=UPI0011A60367|nr:hypothetical protein [Paenibacillus sp. Y412MC10]
MLKKVKILLSLSLMLATPMYTAKAAEPVITVNKNSLDAVPVNIEGTTLVPLSSTSTLPGVLLNKLSSENIAKSRNAAVYFTLRVTLLRGTSPVKLDNMAGATYIFPVSESKRFFYSYSDVISYYEIKNGVCFELWRAKVKYDNSDILIKTIIEESGIQPRISAKLRLVYYKTLPATGEVNYGFIESDGTIKNLGNHKMNTNHDFFEIPGEQ